MTVAINFEAGLSLNLSSGGRNTVDGYCGADMRSNRPVSSSSTRTAGAQARLRKGQKNKA